MNKKGFMMAEVVVVSAIVMTVIVGFYISYNKIYSTYKTRASYYDTTTLYRLGYYRDILIENQIMDDLLNTIIKCSYRSSDNSFKCVDSNDNIPEGINFIENNLPSYLTDTVYFIKLNNKSIDNKIVEELLKENINLTFKDYIQYLSSSTKFSSNYLMLMERCEINNNVKNNNDCKYAYLEIYDGKEKINAQEQ